MPDERASEDSSRKVITTQDFVPTFIDHSELLVCWSLVDPLIETDEAQTLAYQVNSQVSF